MAAQVGAGGGAGRRYKEVTLDSSFTVMDSEVCGSRRGLWDSIHEVELPRTAHAHSACTHTHTWIQLKTQGENRQVPSPANRHAPVSDAGLGIEPPLCEMPPPGEAGGGHTGLSVLFLQLPLSL